MLITEAYAQGADTAIKAGESILAQGGVLGPICILLGLAVIGLYLEVRRCDKRVSDLLERVVTVAEGNRGASGEHADALKDLQAAVNAGVAAMQTLARETQGESREARHGISNLLAGQQSIVAILDRIDRGRP